MADCVHSGETNPEGQIWCKKKEIYVNPKICTEENCDYYEAAV